MPEEIFRTIHGSKLYGFSHTNSDNDFFIVNDSMLPTSVKHKIEGDIDTATASLKTFLELAKSGSHQSAEALFSPYKEYTEQGLMYKPLFDNMYIGGGEVFEKFERTIRKFSHSDFKRRRHAVRLSYHLMDLRSFNRFNPVLTEERVEEANILANQYSGQELIIKLDIPL